MSKEVYKKLFEFRKLTGKVVKSANNPFFQNKYADLNSVIEATDPALEQVGLIYIDRVDGDKLISELVDPESGESIQNHTPLMLAKQDMQQLGSAITYARRYARLAMLGLQAVDDDGGEASGKTFVKPAQIKRIQTLLMDTDTKAPAFLGHYQVQAIKDMTQDVADQAEKTLQLKKDKMGVQNEK
jgi:hypothetical protein